jgi:OOP family OmpA-OmpF porin
MKKIATLLILFLAPLLLQAQVREDYKALGDNAFAKKDYYDASVYYQKALRDVELNDNERDPYLGAHKHKKKLQSYDQTYLEFQLAESYRLFENYVNACPWYYKVLTHPDAVKYPHARLWYGVCLRATQNFDESIKQLEEFLAGNHSDRKYDELARKEIADCRFARKEYLFPKPIAVTKFKGNWNSDGSNYALSKVGKNGFWLTSSRYTSAQNSKKRQPHLNRLYFADKNSIGDADLREVAFKNNPLNANKEAEWGTPALDPTGKHLYFTYWFKQGNKIFHEIYKSEREANGEWNTPKKLNIHVNVEGFNAIQPFVTADGKHLYFASNKPGTAGGYDLWLGDLDDNGNPLSSINLGNTINTKMDEQAPYYNVLEKKLIYSSKGFTGLGGFDFMESKGERGKWTMPVNMGFPMNSAKDDLYFSPDPEQPDLVFISSDRQSDCCLELYTVKNSIATPTYLVSGLVLNCDQQKPLEGAKVTLTDSLSKQTIKEVITDADGKYKFEISAKKLYRLVVEKENYFSKRFSAKTVIDRHVDTLSNPEICLKPFVVGKPIVLNNIFYDYNKANLRPLSKVTLDTLVNIMKDNPQIKIELSAHTDGIGGNQYNLKLSQARAQSCVDYLVMMGISAEKVTAKGYGKTRPVAPDKLPNGKDNPAGRQLNRRTEFTVLKNVELAAQ